MPDLTPPQYPGMTPEQQAMADRDWRRTVQLKRNGGPASVEWRRSSLDHALLLNPDSPFVPHWRELLLVMSGAPNPRGECPT